MGRRIRERAISCQTWSLDFNEISQNATRFKRDGGGGVNLLNCRRVSSAIVYISSVLVPPTLLTRSYSSDEENGTKARSGSSMSRMSLRSRSISSQGEG